MIFRNYTLYFPLIKSIQTLPLELSHPIMNASPTTEERIWAVLSHLSAIAFGMGILLPIIGWSEQRRTSKYASFQCLQALGYQALGYTVWALFSVVILIPFVIIRLPTLNAARGPNTVGIWMDTYVMLIFSLLGSYFLLPMMAAVSCAFGKDFRYPIMGNRLTRYLEWNTSQSNVENNWFHESHEDHWVAAMGHFSILIVFWGMLAPLTTWIFQGKRNSFLKFQTVQTLVYQAGATLLYLGTVFLYIIGLTVLLAMMGLTGSIKLGSPMEIVGIIFMGASFLVLFITILFVPLFHILGQWAGYRVLKGDNYHYPVIGKLTERWIANQTPVAGDGNLRIKALEGKSS